MPKCFYFVCRHSPEQIVLDIQRPYGSKVIPRSLSSASTSENESDKENCAPVQHLHVPLPWQRLSDNGALSWQPNKEESSWQQDEKRGSVCSSLEEMKMTRTEDAMEVSSSTDTSLPSSNDVSLYFHHQIRHVYFVTFPGLLVLENSGIVIVEIHACRHTALQHK